MNEYALLYLPMMTFLAVLTWAVVELKSTEAALQTDDRRQR